METNLDKAIREAKEKLVETSNLYLTHAECREITLPIIESLLIINEELEVLSRAIQSIKG